MMMIGGAMAADFTLNPVLDGMKPSATLAINERSHALKAAGRQIYKLGLGQSPFPVPERVVQALKRSASEKDYLPVQGLLELRDAIARHHRVRDEFKGTADDIMIGPGSKELLFIIQMAHQGTLLLPSPSWVSYGPQAQLINKSVE